jgi:hypothetical protein
MSSVYSHPCSVQVELRGGPVESEAAGNRGTALRLKAVPRTGGLGAALVGDLSIFLEQCTGCITWAGLGLEDQVADVKLSEVTPFPVVVLV